MPCAKLPVPVIPVLPTGLSFPLPPLPTIPNLVLPCCNIPIPKKPINLSALVPLSAIATPAQVAVIMTTLNVYLESVRTFLDQFEISCPLQ